MKVIEPDEIIVENTHRKKVEALPNPWVRFLARMLDYSLLFILVQGIHWIFQIEMPFGLYGRLIPVLFVGWIAVETVLLYTWGNTPGKWFLHLELRPLKSKKLDFISALQRSIAVWLRGLGMGIPFLNIWCLFLAFQRLNLLQTTSWDRDFRTHVKQKPVPRWRVVVAGIIAVSCLVGYYAI